MRFTERPSSYNTSMLVKDDIVAKNWAKN